MFDDFPSLYNRKGLETNDKIVLDFYRALKNQKVFGRFCEEYVIRPISTHEKYEVRMSRNSIQIGNIFISRFSRHFGTVDIIKSVMILNSMISKKPTNVDDYFNGTSRTELFDHYLKEYYKQKKFPIKHTILFYQLTFGIMCSLMSLLMIYGLIYFLFGKYAVAFLTLIIFLYCILVYFKFKDVKLK